MTAPQLGRTSPGELGLREAAAPVLRPGTPEAAGLDPTEVEQLVPAVEPFLSGESPAAPGFVLLAARNGVVVKHAADGYAMRYACWDASAGRAVELPRSDWVPMETGTVFDVASVSKLFTAVVVVRLAELELLELDTPVAHYLPEFAATDPAKAAIGLRGLLTHTSGMAAWADLRPYPDAATQIAAIGAEPLLSGPGEAYAYSDLNLIVLARVAEAVAGKGLDALVAELITGPLGMSDTGYRPPPAWRSRIAATEYQPWTGRGLVHGEAHDENAFWLGGVSGHAGAFSTARDLGVFGQMMLNGGRYGEARVLGERWVREMLAPQNSGLGAEAARGLGWQLNQPFFMDEMASPVTFGHTGYTGTSLVADPRTGLLLVLLTNRVHPTRERGTDSAYRRAPAGHLARAVARAPRRS